MPETKTSSFAGVALAAEEKLLPVHPIHNIIICINPNSKAKLSEDVRSLMQNG